jgi:CheY-like chemotaxis protein
MRTLLLADESITVQRVIALTFAGEPIQVISVGDGQQAIEKMAAKRPDIVLAGTTLPTVNGYDLAKFMRGKTGLRDVPILLLAGAFETVDEAQLASSGANGIIEKPVEPTTVIGRVKELLGLKPEEKPAAPAGRTITSPGGAGAKDEKKLPVATPPRAVTNTKGGPTKWEQLRNQSGLEPNTKSVEDSSTRSDDYLDTLDAAFDTLDQQLSGRAAATKPRNPSGPLAQSVGSGDPRSPGRRPSGEPAVSGNPIFEIDDDWFGEEDSKARADARAGRRELADDLKDAALQAPGAAAPADPIFEVDDEWFKEDELARAAKREEQRELAAEMGIHDVDLPEKEAALTAAPASDLDFDFGLDDLNKPAEPAASMTEELQELASLPQPEPMAAQPEPAAAPPQPAQPEPVAMPSLPTSPIIPQSDPAPAASVSARADAGELRHDLAVAASGREGGPIDPEIADDFAALLAFEQGDPHALPVRPPAPPPEIRVVAPEITDEMLGEIASRVAPPEITDAMLTQIASRVAPPPITEATLDRIAERVAPPVITDAILGEIASRVPAPEISEQMLDQIASRVADRLNSSAFGEQLREQISAVLRDTVRSVVSETSERLVRDEIDRIKARHER